MPKFLSRDSILSVQDCKPVPVSVPEWASEGEETPVVGIRKLNGLERQELNKLLGRDRITDVEIEQAAFIACVADESGKPLFAPGDGPMIAEKFAGVIARLGRKALTVNMFGRAAMEQAEKN